MQGGVNFYQLNNAYLDTMFQTKSKILSLDLNWCNLELFPGLTNLKPSEIQMLTFSRISLSQLSTVTGLIGDC